MGDNQEVMGLTTSI